MTPGDGVDDTSASRATRIHAGFNAAPRAAEIPRLPDFRRALVQDQAGFCAAAQKEHDHRSGRGRFGLIRGRQPADIVSLQPSGDMPKEQFLISQ